MKKLLLAGLMAVMVAFVLAPTTYARPNYDDIFVFGTSRTIRSGEVINGDVHVAGGNLMVEDGAIINGSLLIYGGNATVEGEINGEIVVFGGNINISDTAYVSGQAVSVGGNINAAPGATIVEGITSTTDGQFDFGDVPVMGGNPWRDGWAHIPPSTSLQIGAFDAIGRAMQILLTSVALGALALVVHLFLPKQLENVGATMQRRPLPSLGLGFGIGVGWIVAAVIIVLVFTLLAITIILIPITLMGYLLVAAGSLLVYLAGLLGWLALGTLVGRRLAAESQGALSPAVSAAIGTFAISLLVYFLQEIWFVGWVFGLIYLFLLALGLGAVLLSRLGQDAPDVAPGVGGDPLLPSQPTPPTSDLPPTTS